MHASKIFAIDFTSRNIVVKLHKEFVEISLY